MRFGPFLWSFGADYLTPDKKRSALDTPAARQAFAFFVELYTKHKVVPPGLTAMNPQEVRTQFAQKKVGHDHGLRLDTADRQQDQSRPECFRGPQLRPSSGQS